MSEMPRGSRSPEDAMTMDDDTEDKSSLGESSRAQEYHDYSASTTESFACQNCRQRKVKCNRVYPCAHCAKSKLPCVFPSNQQPRVKRQRVHITSIYENKIDNIAKRIEELTNAVNQLGLNQANNTRSVAAAGQAADSHDVLSSGHPTHSPAVPSTGASSSIADDAQSVASEPEYEGESSFFAHAVFATKFLQSAVNNDPSSEVASEMSSIVDALRRAVHSQKQKTDTISSLYPNARQLPPGASLRSLPVPSADKVLPCLRMAQENARMRAFWMLDFPSAEAFTIQWIKVCSPGPASETEMINAYAGLRWLFMACAREVSDEALKQDYLAQASICRDNLETVLSRLPFHLPVTLESAMTLFVASLYCIERCRPTGAWHFICAASHQSQTLGLHSAVSMLGDKPEVRTRKLRLFWSIYLIERVLALRLGRSSIIRENDITVPRVEYENSIDFAIHDNFPIWLAASSLQGQVYDDIYSPRSLAQPAHIRKARATVLAAEARRLMKAQEDLQIRDREKRTRVLGAGLTELLERTDRVSAYSMLTLIYRSIPPDDGRNSAFCEECIVAARSALEEHERCIAIPAELLAGHFELYVNWALLSSPFTPFIVLFCHMIETSDCSDLDRLKSLVETIQQASAVSVVAVCQKQLRIFKALYDVAVKYFEVKTSTTLGLKPSLVGPPVDPGKQPLTSSQDGVIASRPRRESNMGLNDPQAFAMGQVSPSLLRSGPMISPNQATGAFDMDIDPAGAELANWFYMNNEMWKMFEDI